MCGVPADRFEPVEEAVASGETSDEVRVIVIGGGVAGVTAAETVRQTAHNSTVIMLCHEAAAPYYRLNLTRYLAGEITRDSLPIHPEEWYAAQGIDLRTGVAVASLSSEKVVELASGETLPYDRAILTMGSHAFVPPVTGADRDGVFTLRTAEDADEILQRLEGDGSCIVVGGGILGIETAGALGRQGKHVVLIESHKWLMPRQLNQKAGMRLERHMNGLGVRIVREARTCEILGEDSVSGVLLENGEKIEGEVVILATGVRPNTHLARKAGIEVNRGIVVGNHLESSVPGVFAAGDVAEHNGRLYGAWAPSQYQGRIAGLNAAGVPTEFGGLPRSNALKVLGIDLLSIGQFEPEDGSFLELDDESDDAFAHFVFRDGKMVGSILMGHPSLGPTVKQAVESRRDFSVLLAHARTGADVIEALGR